jgi:hypothetical protein
VKKMLLNQSRQKQVYVILSIDTEHDIVSKYKTRSAGWSNGIPLLFQVFGESGVKGKVCWLIEYNVKEGIPAANPNSEFFVKELPELITEMKNRCDEIGLHPSIAAWRGTGNDISALDYIDHSLWDNTMRYDPEFVMNLIKSGVQEIAKTTGVHPIGCRTGGMSYASHLANALAKNGVYVDSSVSRKLAPWIGAPNAYYANENDIRKKSPNKKPGLVEIPATGYICFEGLQKLLLHKTRIRYLLNRQPVILSFFIHNWQAVTIDGRADREFLQGLASFLGLLRNNGACFVTWAEAYQICADLYGEKLEM